MADIILPKNVLEKEQYLALPSLQKEEFIHNVLKEILLLNQDGVTVSDIAEKSYLGKSTIWHHLEHLNATGECLKMERGDTDVYHLNKVIAPLNDFELKGGKLMAHYHFDIVENAYGRYLRIQRKRESRNKTHTTRQGVIIPLQLLDELADVLIKLRISHFK